MNFLLLLALFSLCLANFHSHSLEERIRNQLIKKEAFLQEKLLNVQFPENENKVSSKRDEEYINVTDKVTITPWSYYLSSLAVADSNVIFAISRRPQPKAALISNNGAVSFAIINSIDCIRDQCIQVLSSKFSQMTFFIGNKVNYLSTDKGLTWARQATDKIYHSFKFHPIHKDWILALELTSSVSYNWLLHISKDAGKTFTPVPLPPKTSYILLADWCRAGQGGLADGRICAISSNFYYFQTDNEGINWHKPVAEQTTMFYIHDRFITLQVRANGTVACYVSSDNGNTFHVPFLPYGVEITNLQKSQWVEDDNGVIWLAVGKNSSEIRTSKSTTGNLYQSDADGDDFVLMLKDIHGKSNTWDYHVVKTIEGTVMANVMRKKSSSVVLNSVISFDNGNTWSPLAPPKTDSNGNELNCDSSKDDCNLHLFGDTNFMGDEVITDFYSADDAVGLIMGTGNVGASLLDINNADLNTYYSRDGGNSWDEIFKGSNAYNFGDHGSLIVLANNKRPTSEIFFSWNAGKNFSVVDLPREIMIQSIFTLSAQSESFILIGRLPNSDAQSWWGLDFSKLHARDCTANDYEEWSQPTKCVLGHNVYYRRRKKESACFTEDDVNHVIKIENCPCTPADYECDSYYDRVVQTGKCVFSGDEALRKKIESEKCADKKLSYMATSGYRKIPGDTCTGDLPEYAPRTTTCPDIIIVPSEPTGSIPTMYWVGGICFIIFSVLGALIVGFCVGVRDERFRKMFPWVNQAPAWVTAGYSNTLIDEIVTAEEWKDGGNDLSSVSEELGSSIEDKMSSDEDL